MSSRKIRHNGQMRKASDIISRTKKYKYNKKGELVEYGGTTSETLADDEFKVAGSKSSLRRIADLERNVTLLITQINTTDGDAKDTDDDDFGTTVNKTTRFKKTVRHSGNVSFDSGDTVTFNGDLVFGSAAEGDIHGLFSAGGDLSYSNGQFSFTERTDTEVKALFSAGGDLSYSNGQFSFTQDHAWSSITGTPTTLAGYGITDSLATDTELSTGLAGKVGTGSPQALASDANALTFSANTLTLKRGDGSTDTVNLSAYLDDTNAARITSGTMANDGTATFTRDDNTTFTVDMSVLLDNDNLARITSASWNTGNGILTLTRNDSSTVTVDLDDRYALNDSAQALRATDALTVSNDTITLHKADGTSESVTTSDANTNKFISAMSFNTSDGVLTATRNDGGTVTVDLDGRFTDNGYADAMNQHVRTTDSPTFAAVTATNFNGTATYAKYADLAERYAADAPYAEGTVVVFGGEAEVTASTSFAQRSVAGVVSLRPAVAMNAEAGNNETHPFIALQGRVPVKVTGDVKKGDILVASDVAGTATAWTNDDADPRMTAYVGIAISDAVDGFVEVKVGK